MELLCRIEMLGQLKVIRADQELTRFRTHKIGWLLAYLALHRDQSVPRERLLDLFWPELEVEAGRGNLNNALSVLRRQLDLPGVPRQDILLADRQSVRLDSQVVRTDVQEFEECLQAASRAGAGTPQQIALNERSIGLYRGELLPGCYDEWALQEQQRLHGLYADALGRWSEALEKAGELAEALTVIQRAVQADIYREEFYRRQMRLQGMRGQAVAALETYRQMERRFEAELGVAPSPATRELARQLKENPDAFAQPSRQETATEQAAPAPQPPPAPAPPVAAPEPSVSLLPLALTRYFGRAEEQAELTMLLAGNEARLVTLLGPGGAGKTRLSLEVARQLAPVFAGRVWWVSLADLPDARLLSATIARALQITAGGVADPLEAVIARLNEAPCLLILDNLEHLLRDDASGEAKGDQPLALDTTTALVRLLLERAPLLRCLVTSRRAVRLNGEQEYPLPPLPLPAVSSQPEEVLSSPSVALYLDRARLARPDFAITPNNAEAVSLLCRKLEGMPLAIEMAAAWAKVLPPAKMLERLEERLDALIALSGRRRDLPARHQSLRATIDWSYDLLDAPQQRLLACLSVFRGGWDLEAAEEICSEEDNEADVLDLLISLVEKSLVVSTTTPDDEERYRLLEPVRQYGSERLTESGDATALRARHFAYFMTMAEDSWQKIKGPEHTGCLNQIEREHDNHRAALAWAGTEEGRQHAGPEAELNLAGRLRPFWDLRGYWREGRERLEAALKNSAAQDPTEIRGRALLGAGILAANRGDRQGASPFYEECLRIRQQLGDTQGIGSVALALGNIARDEGDYPAAHRWYDVSREAVQAIGDSWTYATLLAHLGVLAEREKDFEGQLRYVEEALVLRRQSGDLHGVAIQLHNISVLFMKRGQMAEGYASLEECLTLLQQVGDQRFTALALEQCAFSEFLRGRITNGVRFTAAAQRIRDDIGAQSNNNWNTNIDQARGDIGEAAVTAALAEGRALDRDQAIQEALATIAEARVELLAKAS